MTFRAAARRLNGRPREGVSIEHRAGPPADARQLGVGGSYLAAGNTPAAVRLYVRFARCRIACSDSCHHLGYTERTPPNWTLSVSI